MTSSHQSGETALDRGRAFYQGRAWADAFQALSEADGITPLAPADLQLLALSAALTGHDDEFLTTLERLHNLYFEQGAFAAAARAAFWLGFRLMSLGELGQSAGWMSRVQRLVEREGCECAAQGFLLLAGAFRAIAGGDLAAAPPPRRRRGGGSAGPVFRRAQLPVRRLVHDDPRRRSGRRAHRGPGQPVAVDSGR